MATTKVDKDAWVETQHRTFAAWINANLSNHSKEPGLVENLATDLKDGLSLIYVLEVLTGETVGGGAYNKRATMKILQLNNIGYALKACSDVGIRVTCGADDIYEGNLKMILGLVWTIILRFQIVGYGDHADADGASGSSAKTALLAWVQAQIGHYPDMDVTNFTSSFQDGRAMCALVDSLDPTLLDMDEVTSSMDPSSRADHAFTLAASSFDIPCLMRPSDLIDAPDAHSVMTYVSYFRTVAKHLDASSKIDKASLEEAKKSALEQLDAARARIAELESALSTSTDELAESNASANLLQLRIDQLEATNSELKGSVDSWIEKAASAEAAAAESADALATRDDELARLRAELAAAQASLLESQGQVKDLTAQLAAARADLAAAADSAAAAAKAATDSAADAQARIDALQTELDDTRSGLDDCTDSKAQLSAQLRDTKACLTDTERKLADSAAAVSLTTAKSESIAAELSSTEDALAAAKADVAALTKERDALTADLTAAAADLDAAAADLDAERTTVASLEAELSSRVAQIEELTTTSDQTQSTLSSKLAATRDELAVTRSHAADADADVKRLTAKLESSETTAVELEASLAQKSADFDAISADRDRLELELEQMSRRADQLEASLADTCQAKEALSRERDELTIDLDTTRARLAAEQDFVTSLQDEAASATQTEADLRAKLLAAEEDALDNRDRALAAEARVSQISARLDALENNSDADADADASAAEIAALQTTISELRSKVRAAEVTVLNVTADKDEAVCALDAANSDLAHARAQVQSEQEALAHERQSSESLSTKLVASEAHATATADRADALQARVDELEAYMSEVSEASGRLGSQAADVARERDELDDEVTRLKVEVQSQQEQLAQMVASRDEAMQTESRLTVRLAEESKALADANAALESLKKELADSTAVVASLKSQVQAAEVDAERKVTAERERMAASHNNLRRELEDSMEATGSQAAILAQLEANFSALSQAHDEWYAKYMAEQSLRVEKELALSQQVHETELAESAAAAAREHADDIQRELNGANERNAKMHKDLAKLEDLILALQNKAKASKAKAKSQIAKLIGQLRERDATIQDLSQARGDAAGSLDMVRQRANSLHVSNKQLKEATAASEATAQELREALEEATRQMSDARAARDEMAASLRAERADMDARVQRLVEEAELSEARAQSAEAKHIELEAKISAAKADAGDARSEAAALKVDLRALKAAKEAALAEMEDEVAAARNLTAANAELTEERDSLLAMRARQGKIVRTLRRRLADESAARRELILKLETGERTKEEIQAIAYLQHQNELLRSQVAECVCDAAHASDPASPTASP